MLTLQELCINEIVNHFDRYFSAYSKTKDANLKRKFEFLQRVYSFQIASELHCQDLMKNDYLDFLVNKYLKVLDTEWFKDCPWETVAAKFAEVGSNIKKITFHECNEEMPYQDVIHHLINLEVMSFSYDCTNEILKRIAQFCHNIVEIEIQNCCEVTDEGIKSLCMDEMGKPLCPKLKKLQISGSDIKEESVKYLVKNLRSLEIFDYHDLPQVLYSLHENDLSSLDKVKPYNFTSLTLLNMYFSPSYKNLLKICLSLCPHLKSFACTILNKEQLDLLYTSVELEKLHLECFSNSEEINLNNLLKSKGKKLTSLSVSSCSLSISTLSKSCPSLKHLTLNKVSFKNEDDITPRFHCLESCIFENVIRITLLSEFQNSSPAKVAEVKAISLLLKNSPKLEHIGFKGSDLSSSDLKTAILRCCEHCPIKKVNLSYSEVDMDFAKGILSCHSLQCLILDGSGITEDDEQDLITFAQKLPNNPEICLNENDNFSMSDDEDDTFLNYEFEDDYDAYDDYDEFYQYYDDDDDYDDYEANEYGCYFEL